MRFSGSKFTQNALAAAPDPRQTPCRFQGAASRQGKRKRRERGRREKGKGVLGKGKREGREGKRGGRERGRRRER